MCCAVLPTLFGGKRPHLRRWHVAQPLHQAVSLLRFSRVFLSCKSNARRSVHCPRDHFIITLIISDRPDTRGSGLWLGTWKGACGTSTFVYCWNQGNMFFSLWNNKGLICYSAKWYKLHGDTCAETRITISYSAKCYKLHWKGSAETRITIIVLICEVTQEWAVEIELHDKELNGLSRLLI